MYEASSARGRPRAAAGGPTETDPYRWPLPTRGLRAASHTRGTSSSWRGAGHDQVLAALLVARPMPGLLATAK